MSEIPDTVQLRRGGTSVILHVTHAGLPSVLYWGPDLGVFSDQEAGQFAASQVPFVPGAVLDEPPIVSLLPQQSEGWSGTPGLVGTRNGNVLFPQFATTAVTTQVADSDGGITGVDLSAHDAESQIDVDLHLELSESGLLRVRSLLTNAGADGYALDSLVMALPTPASETSVIDQTGRHLRERDIQTHEFTVGTHLRTLRVGRGHTASSIHGTCEPASGWRSGLVHYVHVAWSGNTQTLAERDTLGFQVLMGGELLVPGEIVLGAGESYESPWLVATWGNGLDEAAGRIHEWLRARPQHPRTPRPVTLNAWEAVYFDHSLPRLLTLVDLAAEIGVERFVLDDGWFGSRRDDRSALGDWVVSADVWPDGLAPLADAVHAAGMQFGLWFEPEMISPDSQAARAHPEWILRPVTHLPIEARHQQVIDLTNPDAYAHVLQQMLTVLADTPIDYIKWDMNRDLYEAVAPWSGLTAYHGQVMATYALMDAVLAAHPKIEIESCAGGGGRVDLAMMERAVRVWGSDCIDPLERQLIEAGTSLLLPPELVGSHVASTVSHTTGRSLNLSLRAVTAMFSHMGIEWDITEATQAERDELRGWVQLHKQLRPLLHTGSVVHSDHPDHGYWVHGVVGSDQSRAIYAITRMATSVQRPTPPLRLPGLSPKFSYRVAELLPDGVDTSVRISGNLQVPWWGRGLTLAGSALAGAGIRFPDLDPERTLLLSITATEIHIR